MNEPTKEKLNSLMKELDCDKDGISPTKDTLKFNCGKDKDIPINANLHNDIISLDLVGFEIGKTTENENQKISKVLDKMKQIASKTYKKFGKDYNIDITNNDLKSGEMYIPKGVRFRKLD